MVDVLKFSSANGCKSDMAGNKLTTSPRSVVKKYSNSDPMIPFKKLKSSHKSNNSTVLPRTPTSTTRSNSKEVVIKSCSPDRNTHMIDSHRSKNTPTSDPKKKLNMKSTNYRAEIGNFNEGSIGGARWHVKTVISKNKPIKVYSSDDFKLFSNI